MIKHLLLAVFPVLIITTATRHTFAAVPTENPEIKACQTIPPARPTGGLSRIRMEALLQCYKAVQKEFPTISTSPHTLSNQTEAQTPSTSANTFSVNR